MAIGSDGGYRSPTGRSASSVVVRWVSFQPVDVVVLGVVVLFVAFLVTGRSSDHPLSSRAALGVMMLLGTALMRFPIVFVTASYEAGEVIVRGWRWLGPERTWRCRPDDIASFDVELVRGKKDQFQWLVLRGADGEARPLTKEVWPGRRSRYAEHVDRLNAWLAELR